MNPFFEISDLEEIGEHIDDILGSHLTPFHVEGGMAIAPLGMRSVFQQTIRQMDMAQTVSGQKERVSVIFTNLTDMALIEDQTDIAVILLNLHDQINRFICGPQEAPHLQVPVEVFEDQIQEIIFLEGSSKLQQLAE